MPCDRKPWLALIIDRWARELSEEEAVRLEQHLAECPDCAAEERRLSELSQAAAPRSEALADPRLEARLVAHLRAFAQGRAAPAGERTLLERAGAAFRRFGLQPLPALAALPILLVALAGGFWLGRTGDESRLVPDSPQAHRTRTGASTEEPAGGPHQAGSAPRSTRSALYAAAFETTPGDMVEIASRAACDSL